MVKSILDLKGEAYDIGKKLQKLREEGDKLIKRSESINAEIDKREKEKK